MACKHSNLEKQQYRASYLAISLLIVPVAVILAFGLSFIIENGHYMIYLLIGLPTLLALVYLRIRMKKELSEAYEFQGEIILLCHNGKLKRRQILKE